MPDELALLHSIDNSLKLLVRHFGANTVPVNGNVPPSQPAYQAESVAPDRDLDGKYGDPEIRTKDPRDWTGDSQLGNTMSQCPAAYLDLVAERLDYFAEQAEAEGKTTSAGKPVAPYNRKDAARARGWAKRIRGGWTPPVQAPAAFPSDAPPVNDDDIPF